MKLEDIDFNNEEQVKKLKDEKIEITVGVLSLLLQAYYSGGGEPDSLNERLEETVKYSKTAFN